MRFSIDGDEKRTGYSEPDGLEHGQRKYDPDLAHPAADYSDSTNNGPLIPPPGLTDRKLLTKIDLRLVPVLSVLYLLAFLDRTNVANAAVFGLREDLGIVTGHYYSTALTIFFVPYVLFEIPSNVILKRLKPHVWLSICTFMFGLVTLCQGLVNNWGGLMTTRFLLGVFEAGMFPGCFYLLSMYYRRPEAQKRFTFFFASTSLAGAFGGLLASAIGKMDGISGYRGWRWVFILEGLLTCVISFGLWFAIPDFPEDAKWLSPAEASYLKARLQTDQGKSGLDRRITFKDLVSCSTDIKVLLGGFMYFGLIVPAYGYAYFAPTIIRSYGYSPIQTQLYSVPPWVVSFTFSMLIATCSDWLRHRFLFTIVPIFIAIAGFSTVLSIHHDVDTMYGALFMASSGVYAAMPIMVCWYLMNLGGHHRRAIGSGWMIGFGNTGGIVATYIFPSTDAKNFFKMGYSICLGMICFAALSCVTYLIVVWSTNKQRDKAGHDTGLTEYEKTEMGDLNPEWRYML